MVFCIACILNRPPKGVENGPRCGQVAATRLMAASLALHQQPPRPPYSGGETAMLSKMQKQNPLNPFFSRFKGFGMGWSFKARGGPFSQALEPSPDGLKLALCVFLDLAAGNDG